MFKPFLRKRTASRFDMVCAAFMGAAAYNNFVIFLLAYVAWATVTFMADAAYGEDHDEQI